MIEQNEHNDEKQSILKLVIVVVLICFTAYFSNTYFDNPIQSRATLIAGFCLILWLSEIVPPYVPTLILWALAAFLLNPLSDKFNIAEVLKWSANPVLLLFFGGFSFGLAAKNYELDNLIAKLSVKLSGGSKIFLIILTVASTAFMSMWMSNIAATAMMIAALNPLTKKLALKNKFRKALLLSIAIGANFGGIATPIGTGPNAIAISHLSKFKQISFIDWMSFALPITLGLLVLGTFLLIFGYSIKGKFEVDETKLPVLSNSGKYVVVIFVLTIFAWLSEPFHGISSPVVAIISAAILFGSNLLNRNDLNAIDWGTIGLISGGISLGTMLEQADLISFWAAKISLTGMPISMQIFLVCFVSAMLAALMSNTATVTMLVPFALSFIPNQSIVVLVAISASFGIPFIISTPINVMVHGEGGLNAKDFFGIGFPLMLIGCLILALTGMYFLSYWF